jgi:hypothetical protein
MQDPQKLRREAREFLDKASTITDKTVRRALLERALRLAQQAGMLEQAESLASVEGKISESTLSDSAQAALATLKRRRA